MNQSIQITRFETLWGGTAANIAAVAARQGVPVALASLVGGNFPDQFYEHLRGLGVDLTELRRIEDAPTPECYIFSDGEDNQVAFVIQGPMNHAHRQGIQTEALRSSERVHLATGNPRYHLTVAREARRMGLPVAFDPGQELHYRWSRRPFMSMLRLTDLLFLSEAEMHCTLHYTGASRIEELLDIVPTIVITLGRGGSRMLRRDGPEVRAGVVRVRAVEDTTGAGDAFRGGFYSGMWRGLSDERCMMLGAATASFVVETRGPQTNMPTYEQASERLQAATSTCGKDGRGRPARHGR
jgi:sugar/nucleoside kinase (ribokinase family)